MSVKLDTDDPTRAGRGEKLYGLWVSAGGRHPIDPPFAALPKADQARWVWLAKMVGEPKHHHHVPLPADVVNYPGATLMADRPELYDYDEANHTTPQVTLDQFYHLWVQSKLATTRQHWWQFRRPRWVDTSRATFEQERQAYLKATRYSEPQPIGKL